MESIRFVNLDAHSVPPVENAVNKRPPGEYILSYLNVFPLTI